ncbi:hypothetical protein EDB89DRAFT_1426298 [Lactarius sanguifluus]|nr:hypothetical protein EDB89DRAFT_1426298 [Lactarius sanguifluus]
MDRHSYRSRPWGEKKKMVQILHSLSPDPPSLTEDLWGKDSEDDNYGEVEWDPHAGTKPSQLDGEDSDEHSVYWGWCKGRYRETGFADAKKRALEYLNACPTEVIRRFFNRSWRVMDAYRHGLTGKAAEWAVRKQKSHRRVGPQVMMSVDAILN